jgi:hypothetical protein
MKRRVLGITYILDCRQREEGCFDVHARKRLKLQIVVVDFRAAFQHGEVQALHLSCIWKVLPTFVPLPPSIPLATHVRHFVKGTSLCVGR